MRVWDTTIHPLLQTFSFLQLLGRHWFLLVCIFAEIFSEADLAALIACQVTFIMGFFVQLNISRWWNHRPDLVIWASLFRCWLLFHVWSIVWSRVSAEVSLPKVEVLSAGSS